MCQAHWGRVFTRTISFTWCKSLRQIISLILQVKKINLSNVRQHPHKVKGLNMMYRKAKLDPQAHTHSFAGCLRNHFRNRRKESIQMFLDQHYTSVCNSTNQESQVML